MGSQGDAQSGKRRTEERRELHSNYEGQVEEEEGVEYLEISVVHRWPV